MRLRRRSGRNCPDGAGRPDRSRVSGRVLRKRGRQHARASARRRHRACHCASGALPILESGPPTIASREPCAFRRRRRSTPGRPRSAVSRRSGGRVTSPGRTTAGRNPSRRESSRIAPRRNSRSWPGTDLERTLVRSHRLPGADSVGASCETGSARGSPQTVNAVDRATLVDRRGRTCLTHAAILPKPGRGSPLRTSATAATRNAQRRSPPRERRSPGGPGR